MRLPKVYRLIAHALLVNLIGLIIGLDVEIQRDRCGDNLS